jgi:hypothetical protein
LKNKKEKIDSGIEGLDLPADVDIPAPVKATVRGH